MKKTQKVVLGIGGMAAGLGLLYLFGKAKGATDFPEIADAPDVAPKIYVDPGITDANARALALQEAIRVAAEQADSEAKIASAIAAYNAASTQITSLDAEIALKQTSIASKLAAEATKIALLDAEIVKQQTIIDTSAAAITVKENRSLDLQASVSLWQNEIVNRNKWWENLTALEKLVQQSNFTKWQKEINERQGWIAAATAENLGIPAAIRLLDNTIATAQTAKQAFETEKSQVSGLPLGSLEIKAQITALQSVRTSYVVAYDAAYSLMKSLGVI